MLALALLPLVFGSVPTEHEPELTPLPDIAAVTKALQLREQPLLVHFWALWCPPCVAELPRQVALARRARTAGADVLFISVDEPEKAPAIRERLRSLGAFEAARQAHMDMKVDAAEVARLLDKGWDGSLPATFALVEGRKAPLSIRGELGKGDERRVLAALEPPRQGRPPGVPAKTSPPF